MAVAEWGFRIKSRTVRRASGVYLEELLRNQHLSTGELVHLQQQRAMEMAQFADANTQYYRRIFAEQGIDVTRLDDPAEWERIPITDRASVKADAAAFRAGPESERHARPALTGGSTGEPLRTQHDARVPSLALAWRMYSWWGVDPWDDLARLARWGFGRFETLRNRVQWWPTTQVYLDASLIDDTSMRAFHQQIVRTRPALIEGYVGAMLEFTDFLEREGLTIPAPKAVATTAAPLPATTRARIESVLGAPVYDEYRGSEFGWMAGECRFRTGLHIFSDARKIEIVGPDGSVLPSGEIGDIVVTDLTNRVFPLIRYRLGDRGSLMEGVCECGISLPRMAQPEGRITDVLRLPSGKAMNHRLMAMFAAHPEAVRLFQIHQLADYSIVVRVVLGEEASAREDVEKAVDVLRQRVGGEVPVTVEYVDSLPYTGAKTKYVISDVSPR